MSLLPPAMKIKDAIHMTFGQAVKRALDKAEPVDSIRAFEVGDWMPDSLRPPRQRKELTPSECETCGGTGQTIVPVCYGGPVFERKDDCHDCDGHGGTEAIQADEPSPQFKAGDKVRVLAGPADGEILEVADVYPNRVLAVGYMLRTTFSKSNLELLPPTKQEGEWVAWNGGLCPVTRLVVVEVKFAGGAIAKSAAGAFNSNCWSHTSPYPENFIVDYRVVPQ